MNHKRNRYCGIEQTKNGNYVCAIWHMNKHHDIIFDVPYDTEYNSWGKAVQAIRQVAIDNDWKVIE